MNMQHQIRTDKHQTINIEIVRYSRHLKYVFSFLTLDLF